MKTLYYKDKFEGGQLRLIFETTIYEGREGTYYELCYSPWLNPLGEHEWRLVNFDDVEGLLTPREILEHAMAHSHEGYEYHLEKWLSVLDNESRCTK